MAAKNTSAIAFEPPNELVLLFVRTPSQGMTRSIFQRRTRIPSLCFKRRTRISFFQFHASRRERESRLRQFLQICCLWTNIFKENAVNFSNFLSGNLNENLIFQAGMIISFFESCLPRREYLSINLVFHLNKSEQNQFEKYYQHNIYLLVNERKKQRYALQVR